MMKIWEDSGGLEGHLCLDENVVCLRSSVILTLGLSSYPAWFEMYFEWLYP